MFGAYPGEHDNYSTCVFSCALFSHPYSAGYLLLEPTEGMLLVDEPFDAIASPALHPSA